MSTAQRTAEPETAQPAELYERIVQTVRLRHRITHRGTAVALAVLAVACLTATITRLSFLPLAPLPAFALAGYALYRVRAGGDDRKLVIWSSVAVGATLVGFWLMSVIGRALGS